MCIQRPSSQPTHHKTGTRMELSGQQEVGRPRNTWCSEVDAEQDADGKNWKHNTTVSGGKGLLMAYAPPWSARTACV